MQTLVMSKDNLRVLLLIIVTLTYIVEPKPETFSKLIFKKLSTKELDQSKDYLA